MSTALALEPSGLGDNNETSYMTMGIVPDGYMQPYRDAERRRWVLCWVDTEEFTTGSIGRVSWVPLDEVYKHYWSGFRPMLVPLAEELGHNT